MGQYSSIEGEFGRDEEGLVHHQYYQWVAIILVLQAAACYAPWAAWKTAEGGMVSKLLDKVSKDPLTETPVEEQVANLGDFLLTHRGWFNATAVKLLLCQVSSIFNIYTQHRETKHDPRPNKGQKKS